MKKILCFAPLSSGHLQKWVGLLENEFDFFYITMHPEKDIKNKKSNVYIMPRLTGTKVDYLYAVFYLQYVLIKEKPALLYVSYFSSYGLIASLAKANCNKFLSVWGSDVNNLLGKKGFFKKLLSYAINQYSFINSPAQHLKIKLIGLGAKEESIAVYQYGVSLNKLVVKDVEKVNKDSFKFISIRNWGELYNIENIISAFEVFMKKYPNAELTIIGKGDEAESEKIKILSNKPNINVVGFVLPDELPILLSMQDVAISIPRIDGTPLSLLECMYTGLLPVVSNIDANREWLDNDSAVFVEHSNIESIVEGFDKAVDLLLKDNVKRVIRNRQIVADFADYDKNTARLKNDFNRCL